MAEASPVTAVSPMTAVSSVTAVPQPERTSRYCLNGMYGKGHHAENAGQHVVPSPSGAYE